MSVKNFSDIPEYRIFEAFVKHSKYSDALKELEQCETENKGLKIFNNIKLKKSMQYSFNLFRETIKNKKLPSNTEEYSNIAVLTTLREGLKYDIFPFMSRKLDQTTSSISKAKIDIGCAMIEYAEYMNNGGKKVINDYKRQEERRAAHEQPRVSKHGSVGHGGYGGGNVFTPVSRTFKTNRQVLLERQYKGI